MNLEKEVFELSVEDILPNRFQPREKFSDEDLNELAISIKEHGVIQPIIVRKIGDKYEIVAGERRYRASKIAGKATIPALIRNIDDRESAKIALLENLQRKNLTPIEEAKTYQTIIKLDNLTQEELAANLGKSQSAIANKLRLLNLDSKVQQALLDEKISERHARSLLNLDDKEKQVEMLEKIILNRMTVKQLDEEIAKITGKTPVEEQEEITPPMEEEQINKNIDILVDSSLENSITLPNLKITENDPIKENLPIEDPIDKNVINQNNIEEIPSNSNPGIFDINSPNNELNIINPNPIDDKPINIFDQLRMNDKSLNEPLTDKNDLTNEKIIDNDHHEIEETIVPNYENINTTYDEVPKKDSVLDSYNNIEQKITNNNYDNNKLNSNIESNQTVAPITPNNNDIYDLRFAINNFRQAIQNTEKFGFNIESEEFDFNNIYQIVIKIDKNK